MRAPWVALLFALGGIVMSTANLGWLTPAANVQLRQRMIALTRGRLPHFERGARELSLPELLAVRAPADTHRSVTADVRRQELLTRATVAIAWPVTFSWFGWRLSRHRRRLSPRALIGWWAFAGIATLLLTGSVTYSSQSFAVVGVPVLWLIAAALLRRPVADAAAHV